MPSRFEPRSHIAYREDIDGLRAIAVLSVVGFHAFPTRITGGFVGVDVFFVISGYLISTIVLGALSEGRFGFASFYAGRVRRLFPALAVVLVASYFLGWRVLLPHEYKQLSRDIVAGAGFLSNFGFWSDSGYFDASAELKPLLHLWSLSVEEQFYLVWPLFLFVASKWRFNLLRPMLVIILGSFTLNVVVTTRDPVASFYLPATRLWELALGGVLASIVRTRRHPSQDAPGGMLRARHANVMAVVGSACITAAVVGLNKGVHFPGWWVLLPTIGTVLVISAGPNAWLNHSVLSLRPLVAVGLISYPLYLWHWPLLSFARIVEPGEPPREVRITIVLLSAGLASLTYLLIERPLRFGKHTPTTMAAIIVSMVLIGCVGLVTFQRNGLPFRSVAITYGNVSRYDYRGPYREDTCFLKNEEGSEQDFSIACTDTLPSSAPLVFLWGDSHAAHLYPGLRQVRGGAYRISQRTASGCPPLLNFGVRCRRMNRAGLDLIRELHPDEVILAADWMAYDRQGLPETIGRLREIGVRRITVAGPVPHWNGGLPQTIVNWIRRNPSTPLPRRMIFGLRRDIFSVDESMRRELEGGAANYVSAVKILCNQEGCLTRTGDTADTLTAWDGAHLTNEGSRYLVERFPR